MALFYDIGKFSLDLAPDDQAYGTERFVSTSPSWVVYVVRFSQLVSYSRASRKSIDLAGSSIADERAPLVIADDCVSISVGGDKSTHVKNMSCTLVSGGKNYLAEIMPGDWIMAWMCDTPTRAQTIVTRLSEGKSCNGWDSGLKFIGRVFSVRKKMSVSDSGAKTVRYLVTANAFEEFDSEVFFDTYLSSNQETINTWLGKMDLAINDFLTEDGIDINQAIPALVEILFGKGFANSIANPTGEAPVVTGATPTEGAPFAYVVPATVGKVLGKLSRSSGTGILAYADLLQAVYGVQKYSGSEARNDLGESSPRNVFVPDGIQSAMQSHSGVPMLGLSAPVIPNFNGGTVWSCLSVYLNPTINEMYTCLRINSDNELVPTLVVRQLPFNTEQFAYRETLVEKSHGLKEEEITRFLELPRWKVPSSLIVDVDIGRGNALRKNFIHMVPNYMAQARNDAITASLIRNPPIRDDQDISRSGLRMDNTSVNVSVTGNANTGELEKWIAMRADFMMGQHLTLQGTIECIGISAPICIGDNLEWDGVVFHIESVSHNCSIDDRGHKKFRTSITVTHGVLAKPIDDTDLGQYAGTGYGAGHPSQWLRRPTDQRTFTPGLTDEKRGK